MCVRLCVHRCVKKPVFSTELKDNFASMEGKENHMTISRRCFGKLSIFLQNELEGREWAAALAGWVVWSLWIRIQPH